MAKIINKILHPNKLIGISSFILGFSLLIYVFSLHLETTPIAYVAYLWSTYDLIIFLLWLIKTCRFSKNYVQENSKIYEWYNKNSKIITKISLYISLIINFIYGIFKFITALYYRSFWFITFAIYYLALWEMKASLIKGTKSKETKLQEYKILKKTGITLLLLDFVLTGIIVLVQHQNQVISYPGYLIYAIAIYDFYLMISAIINALKYKKHKSPVTQASKCINLIVAMISIISLEVSMIYEFGNNDITFRNTMISITGLIVVIINSFMSIYMILKANRKLRLNK